MVETDPGKRELNGLFLACSQRVGVYEQRPTCWGNRITFLSAFYFILFINLLTIWGVGAERERERENPEQASGCCQPRARRGARAHELRDHDLSWNRESDA